MCVAGRGERVAVTGVVLRTEGNRALVLLPAPETRSEPRGIVGAADVWLPLDGLTFLEDYMATIEELEKRRAERRAKFDGERAKQEAADLEAIDKLEEAGGAPLSTMTANGFKPGVPVRIAFRAPNGIEYKRYCDQVARAQAKNDPAARIKAQELLAAVCLVYPETDSDARGALMEAFPGTLISLAIEAAKIAELSSEEEGKG